MAHVPAPRHRARFKPVATDLPFDYIENAIIGAIGEEAYERVVQVAAARIAHPHQGHPWLLPEEIVAELASGWDRADRELGEVDA